MNKLLFYFILLISAIISQCQWLTINSNTAYIYFDFNPPVITNTTESLIDTTVVSVEEANYSEILIYPNSGSPFDHHEYFERNNL